VPGEYRFFVDGRIPVLKWRALNFLRWHLA
jgi:hypothetical protein